MSPCLGAVSAGEGRGGLGGPGPVTRLLADKPVLVPAVLVIPRAVLGVDAGA